MNEDDEVVFDDELDALAAELDDSGDGGGPMDDGSDGENPADSQDQAPVDDDDVDDSDDVEDDEDSEDDPNEDEEDEEDVPDEKTISAMQARINKLTAKSKSAESRAEQLERELEEAEAKLEAQAGRAVSKFQTPKDVDARIAALKRDVIPALEDEVDGVPNWVIDEDSGERVPNLVQIDGKSYEVRQVKRRIRELEDEVSELPKMREQLEKAMAEGEKARKLLPQAWKRGTPAFEARKAVLREFPGAAALGDAAVVRLVLGKLALDKATRKPVPKPKPGTGLKSGASATKTKPQKKAVRVEGLDKELSELAAVLDD
jgi:prefoldin subunit 5